MGCCCGQQCWSRSEGHVSVTYHVQHYWFFHDADIVTADRNSSDLILSKQTMSPDMVERSPL